MTLICSKATFHLAAINMKQENILTSSQRIDFVCLPNEVTPPSVSPTKFERLIK
jgi:hypothetical protein